jgi:hypothetical protein
MEKWKSPVYEHYDLSVERLTNSNGSPLKIRFKFTCRFDPINHPAHFRDREKTAQGTTNLSRGMKACLKIRGTDGDSAANSQQNLHRTISTYTEHRHRALISLRCAASHRAFNMIEDPLYLEEIEMLRPGTRVPSTSTVSRDLQTLYQEGSKLVVDYFSVCFRLFQNFNLIYYPEILGLHSPCCRWLDSSLCCVIPRYCRYLVR